MTVAEPWVWAVLPLGLAMACGSRCTQGGLDGQAARGHRHYGTPEFGAGSCVGSETRPMSCGLVDVLGTGVAIRGEQDFAGSSPVSWTGVGALGSKFLPAVGWTWSEGVLWDPGRLWAYALISRSLWGLLPSPSWRNKGSGFLSWDPVDCWNSWHQSNTWEKEGDGRAEGGRWEQQNGNLLEIRGDIPRTTWSESRLASYQAGACWTLGLKVGKEVGTSYQQRMTLMYRQARWMVRDFRWCTFTDFTLVHRLSPWFLD